MKTQTPAVFITVHDRSEDASSHPASCVHEYEIFQENTGAKRSAASAALTMNPPRRLTAKATDVIVLVTNMSCLL
jgi:hypothetical protein